MTSQWLCLDCPKDLLAPGADYHSIKNELWRQIVPRSQRHGMLCHDCIQRRLGRALTPEDFYQRSEAVDSDDPLRGPMTLEDYGILDDVRVPSLTPRAPQQDLPLAAVSDCQQHAVRSFPEHHRRDPKGPASAHFAPVCHMHYDAACPQWNGSIAVASRCTLKTTRLRTFTSSRQVTSISVVIESLEVLAGTADSRDVTEALTLAKTNRDALRRLWRQYSE